MARREKLNLGFQRPRALSKSKLRAPGCYTQNFLRPRYRRHLSQNGYGESYFSSLRANVSLPSARGETWPRTRCFSWVRRSPCSFLTSGAYALVEPLPVAPAPRDSHSPAWLVTTGAPVSWSHTSPWLLGSWRVQAGTLALTTSGAGFYCTSHRNLVL